jgi:hypothetical protein
VPPGAHSRTLCPSLDVGRDTPAVTFFAVGGSRVGTRHSVTQSIVEEHGNLGSRRGDRLRPIGRYNVGTQTSSCAWPINAVTTDAGRLSAITWRYADEASRTHCHQHLPPIRADARRAEDRTGAHRTGGRGGGSQQRRVGAATIRDRAFADGQIQHFDIRRPRRSKPVEWFVWR